MTAFLVWVGVSVVVSLALGWFIREAGDEDRPLILIRTWSGSYVEGRRAHLALLGWIREWWARAMR